MAGKPYKGIDVLGIVSEELFRAAVTGLNEWKTGISEGRGATGSRGRPWVNTGEARSNLTIRPQEPGALSYSVGGNVAQLFIAEFGRAPHNTMPPEDVIAQWVHDKGIARRGTPEFARVVWAIRKTIAIEGIKGFAPAQQAAHVSQQGLEARLKKRLDAALRE